MSSIDLIVVEPTGKQKKYTLKPHGELEKVQKRWRSHLKNIGASWSDKKKQWTLSRDKLKDFEKIQAIVTSSDQKEPEQKSSQTISTKDKKKHNKRHSASESEEDDEEEDEEDDEEAEEDSEESSDSDEEVIEFLKNKIKNLYKSTHDKMIQEDVENSEEEDIVRTSRRIRYILSKLQSLEQRVKGLEEENAFLHKQMSQLKK
jgi:hypothetical protein